LAGYCRSKGFDIRCGSAKTSLKKRLFMKKNFLTCAALGLTLVIHSGTAAPLTESTYTEIIKEVNTLDTGGSTSAAKLNDLLKAPNRVRTGPDSRAELTAADQSITRVGANTVFSFSDNGRTLNLDQGNILFHAPKGVGGGTIKSGGASAAVLGTTLIVSATADGGFKVIMLEGRGTVTLANGKSVTLKGGQMVFVLPNGGGLSQVININLGKLVAGSNLVRGFSHPLSSLPLIQKAIDRQNSDIAAGNATDTRLPANGLEAIDLNSYMTATHQEVTGNQFLLFSTKNPGLGGRTLTTGGG
jgi:hypothetical protein